MFFPVQHTPATRRGTLSCGASYNEVLSYCPRFSFHRAGSSRRKPPLARPRTRRTSRPGCSARWCLYPQRAALGAGTRRSLRAAPPERRWMPPRPPLTSTAGSCQGRVYAQRSATDQGGVCEPHFPRPQPRSVPSLRLYSLVLGRFLRAFTRCLLHSLLKPRTFWRRSFCASLARVNCPPPK